MSASRCSWCARSACATSADWPSRCTSEIVSTPASSSSAAQSLSPSKPASTRSMRCSTEASRLRRGSVTCVCGAPFLLGARFCATCGRPVAEASAGERGRCRRRSERLSSLRSASRRRSGVLPGLRDTSPRNGRGRYAARGMRSGWVIRAAVALVVALAGAALAVAATDGRKRRSSARDRDRWLCNAPRVHHSPTSLRGRRRGRRRTGPPERTDGRSRSPRFHRPAAGVSPSRERRRPAHAGSRRWESSTPRSTPACIRGTGWCSPASMGPRPRRRAICSVRGGSPAPRRCVESSPETLVRCPGSATGDPDFVTAAEKTLHSPLRSFEAVDFPPTESDPSRSWSVHWKTTSRSYAPVCINTRERFTARSSR